MRNFSRRTILIKAIYRGQLLDIKIGRQWVELELEGTPFSCCLTMAEFKEKIKTGTVKLCGEWINNGRISQEIKAAQKIRAASNRKTKNRPLCDLQKVELWEPRQRQRFVLREGESMIDAYCVKCGCLRELKPVDIKQQKNGTQLLKGLCPSCGKTLCRIVNKYWRPI